MKTKKKLISEVIQFIDFRFIQEKTYFYIVFFSVSMVKIAENFFESSYLK